MTFGDKSLRRFRARVQTRSDADANDRAPTGGERPFFWFVGSVVAGNRSHHDLRRVEALAAQVNVVAGERNHLDLLFRAAA